jgi:hypothetical protein
MDSCIVWIVSQRREALHPGDGQMPITSGPIEGPLWQVLRGENSASGGLELTKATR